MHIKKRKHTKSFIALFVIIVVAIFAGGGYYYWNNHGSFLGKLDVNQSKTATVFIPGLGGNNITTGYMVDTLNRYHLATKTLQLYVKKDGTVKTTKQFHKIGADNPTVQIVFQENHRPYFQSTQMPKVMHYLYTKYNIRSVNMIGHSSGGNIIYYYLAHYPNLKEVPTVNKFISLATNYAPNDPDVKNLPKNLQIMNLVGDMNHSGTDGEVTMKSEIPMKGLVTGHVKNYKLYVYHGNSSQAQHTMLHENPSIVKIIAEYFFTDKFDN
ncbi:alpha/beta fold hydrolase [Fructilactobacillus fructivorans]|uniref:Cell surface hydrolase, membrane-bound n=1 Tax=Fructilactobacillus fructivorans TaxID=1614 RepID=A0A0C1PQ33_9LACO|nr:alpha/beta fold hydrolase [Fructilactobacillus fructivorans]KID42001.1 Cell surface hydrolase, membrane-bound [Fructilactobacillus fructivorans]MCT0151658.1 alpha/beta fold hydrolase [Fructilactobacillus fructivorans]MCT2867213.1 alpha/beta fold hydrolase [Fructilactobacillus fructivorans]MCT2868226.1 alpha/beta fold hydrolase [Fructilactobacillus fructivorans]MCT2872934.1 alpha/beta fold hydrolase [Fructilactobacillus fructivorans]